MLKFWALAALATMSTSAAAQQAEESVLIAKGAEWSYYTPTGTPKGDWKRGKGTRGWQVGKTSIGYDKTDVVTIFPAFEHYQKAHPAGEQHGDHDHAGGGSEVAKAYPAIYYRRAFDWDPMLAAGGKEAVIGLRCDDACVVFVNGKEAVRAHLPEGPVKFYATEGMMKSRFYSFVIPATMLAKGKNQIAVAVYNADREDHDHAFNAELVVKKLPTTGG